MKITIRTATLGDLKILREFEQALIQIERPMNPTLQQEGKIYYYDIEAQLASENSEILLAVDGNEVVGCGRGDTRKNEDQFQESHHGYIGFIYVKDSHRGKGVGQIILQGLMDKFKAEGLKEVRLNVYEENPRAIRAYEKIGFSKNMIEMTAKIDH